MTIEKIIIAIVIHLAHPLIGLFYFLRINIQMKNENIPDAPTTELFFIFSSYGGLLLVTLTKICWQWSGIAPLRTLYLILGAPIVMSIIAYRLRHSRSISTYHYWTYLSGVLYFATVTFGILFFSK